MKWEESVRLIKEEMKMRRKITPGALIPVTYSLINVAEKAGCGARFAGAGAGGAVWALGQPENIDRLKNRWSNSLKKIKGAYILECAIDQKGVC